MIEYQEMLYSPSHNYNHSTPSLFVFLITEVMKSGELTGISFRLYA